MRMHDRVAGRLRRDPEHVSAHVHPRRRFRNQLGARARRPLFGRSGIRQSGGRLSFGRAGRSARSERRPAGAPASRRLSVRPRGEHQGGARRGRAQTGFRPIESRRDRRRLDRVKPDPGRREEPAAGVERQVEGRPQRAVLAVEGSHQLARGGQDHRALSASFGRSTSPNAAGSTPRNGSGPSSGIA